MARSPLSTQLKWHNIVHHLCLALGVLLLAYGAFSCLITSFGLKYSFKTALTGNIRGGFIKTWNEAAEFIGKSDYILLDQYAGGSKHCGLFLTITLLIFILLSCLIYKSRSLVLPFAFALIAGLFTITLKLMPGADSVILFACGIAMLIMYKQMEERMGFASLAIVISMLLVTAAFIHIPEMGRLLARNGNIAGLSDNIYKASDELRHGTDGLGCGDLRTDNRKKTGTALKVRMKNIEPLYFRGFVGETYQDSKWKTLDNDTHYDNIPLIRGLSNAGFSGFTELTQVAGLGGEPVRKCQITIQVDKASRKYAYTPYELVFASNAGINLPAGKKTFKDAGSAFINHSDSYLTTRGFLGKNKYAYDISGNLTGKWTDIAGKLYSKDINKEIDKYTASESHYNRFVYSTYTALTDSQIDMLLNAAGTRGNQSKGHIAYKTAISKVRHYLNDNAVYTKLMPQGKERGAEYLFKTHKGRDVEFASAATLLFRYYGIPARYVEGYILTKNDVKKAKGDTVNIPLSNQHAWTEIYIDGIGFVPIETVPEYIQLMPQPDMSKGLEMDSSTNPFNQSESYSSGKSAHKMTQSKGKTIPWRKIFIAILIITLSVLLLTAILYLLKKIIEKIKLKQAFHQDDVAKAICAMFDYARTHNIELPSNARIIGEEAAYSNHNMTEYDRIVMLNTLHSGGKMK